MCLDHAWKFAQIACKFRWTAALYFVNNKNHRSKYITDSASPNRYGAIAAGLHPNRIFNIKKRLLVRHRQSDSEVRTKKADVVLRRSGSLDSSLR
jgi:hypothetical protein